MWRKVNFNLNLIGFSSDISFSYNGYHTKVKESSPSYSLPVEQEYWY